MKDDGRIPRIKDTDMTDRLLMAGAIAEDTRNPIGDIAACFPGHGCLSGFPEARQVDWQRCVGRFLRGRVLVV